MRLFALILLFLTLPAGLLACGDDDPSTEELCQAAREANDYGESCSEASDCAQIECACKEQTMTVRTCVNDQCMGMDACRSICQDMGGWQCD